MHRRHRPPDGAQRKGTLTVRFPQTDECPRFFVGADVVCAAVCGARLAKSGRPPRSPPQLGGGGEEWKSCRALHVYMFRFKCIQFNDIIMIILWRQHLSVISAIIEQNDFWQGLLTICISILVGFVLFDGPQETLT